MSDLVALIQRLREPISVRTTTPINPDGPEAADKLEAMQEALKPFADCVDQIGEDEPDWEWAKFRLIIGYYRRAKAALDGKSYGFLEQRP